MAGGGALNLSLLSRGVGEVQTNGHEKVEVFLEPEDYYNFRDVPQRYYFPPIKHKYTMLQDMPVLSSRESRDHQEIHLPKTFTTRKGALLLFSEDLALRDSERDQAEHPQAKPVSKSTDGSVDLRTVDDLAKSILSYGNHDSNSVYLKFLHRKREKHYRQIRPGFSAKRYLATWTKSWDDSVLETVINKGYITERSLFQYNFVIPHLKRRIFHEDLSHYPPPYRLMRNMLISPGSLSGYTFYRAVPELEDMIDQYQDRELEGESMRSRPPTSIKVIRTRNGEQREVSYASLDRKSQEEVITDLLVKSAVHYALKKQQEYLNEDIDQMEAANADIHASTYAESERKVSSSVKTPVPQFDMKEAVESLLDSHRQQQLDVDFPAIDNQSHSSDYGGSFKGSNIPSHAVKGHSAKNRSWPYGIDEAGKEYIGIAPVVSLRESSSSPSGSVTSIPQLPAISRHPLTPIKDVSRETTYQNITLPPIFGQDGVPMVNVEPPTPQHSTLMNTTELDGRPVPPKPSKDEEEQWRGSDRRKKQKKTSQPSSERGPMAAGGSILHSSSESIAHSGIQSIPSKQRPHWKGSQQSLKSVGSKKGPGSVIGDGSLKGSVICAPDGEIINVGGSVGPSKQSDVAQLQDVMRVNKRVGDGEVAESIPSDTDEPEEWKESRRRVHMDAKEERRSSRKESETLRELDASASIHQWNYASSDQGRSLAPAAPTLITRHVETAYSDRGYDDEMFESEWEPITEKPEEEARAMMSSREPTMDLELTPHPPTENKSHESTDPTDDINPSQMTNLSQPTLTTDPSRESTEITVTKTKSKSSKTRSTRNSTPSAGGTLQGSRAEGEGSVQSARTTGRSRTSERSNRDDSKKKRSEERSRCNTVKSSRKESDPDDDVFDNDNPVSIVSDTNQRKSSCMEGTPRSGRSSDMKRKESKSRNRTPVSGGRPDLNRNRGSSRNSVRSRNKSNDLPEAPDQKQKDGLNESRGTSSRQESGKSLTAEDMVISDMNQPASTETVANDCLLPNINTQRSISVVSGQTSVFEGPVNPGGTSNRSQSGLTNRSRSSDRRKSVTQMIEETGSILQDGTKENLLGTGRNSSTASSKSSNPKNGSDLKEKLPPLNLSGCESPTAEDCDVVSATWADDMVVSGRDDSDGQNDGKAPSQSMSRTQSQSTEKNSRILSGESHLSGSLQVTGEQVFLPSVPASPRTRPRSVRSLRSSRSTVSRIDEESSASEQLLVDALTEHAQKIAQSVLSQSEAGHNLETDIRQAASLWADRHPTRDISRSQSVQEPTNTDAIDQIMKKHRTTSADPTAAEYREEIRRNLTTAVATAAGLSPDAFPPDAEISPELLEALANNSLSPEDIEMVKDEESGKNTLRSKGELSKAMGGVKEGHLFVSPGGDEEGKPTISIPSDRASVKDVGDVDVISYGVPEPGDLIEPDRRSKSSSKHSSIVDGGSETRSFRKSSDVPVEDDFMQAVKKIVEKTPEVVSPAVVSPAVVSPAVVPKPTPEDATSEHGSTKTGVSKTSQKTDDSKGTKKKKPVSIEDREEFVVGKVEDKKELEKLYGPVDPPPPPKPSPPKMQEKKEPEVVTPPEPPKLEQESPPQEVASKLDIPPDPPKPKSPVPQPKNESPPKKQDPPLPPKPKPEPPPKKEPPKPQPAKPNPKKQLPPIKKEPEVKKEAKTTKPEPKKVDESKEEVVEPIAAEVHVTLPGQLPLPEEELSPLPSKPAMISVQPPVESETRASTPSKPETVMEDLGRVEKKSELSSLYSQLPPPPPPKKDVKGKPKAKPKVEKPPPPKKEEKKKKEKKTKVKKEKVEKPPPPKAPSPPPVEGPKPQTPNRDSPEPEEITAPSPDNKSEDMEFVFVREQSESPEMKKQTPLPREPPPPPEPVAVVESESEDIPDDKGANRKAISNKDARQAKRNAAAAKKREEVERRRREKEEEVRRQREEADRQEQLRNEMEEERKRRDEERRLRKLREEEERKKEEQAAIERERRKQMELERERRAKEEYQRKLEEMKKKQAEEEQRRIEAMLEKQREEEERRREEEEMMSQMAEQERLQYERKKQEEEEQRRRREEEEKKRREEEAQRALEEAKRLAEEMARRQAELEARLKFNRDLQLESHGLTHTQDITKMFVFSYFELLQWLGLDIPEFDLQKLAQF